MIEGNLLIKDVESENVPPHLNWAASFITGLPSWYYLGAIGAMFGLCFSALSTGELYLALLGIALVVAPYVPIFTVLSVVLIGSMYQILYHSLVAAITAVKVAGSYLQRLVLMSLEY
tara:strand:+ start:354 stop:704 length:351 start_codon:yes stop_codon:yes gene_type:complete